MSLIVYVPDIGFKWMPSVADHPKVKKLHQQWGDSAIYYLCYYSHPCSPYLFASEEERNNLVIDELKAKKLGHKQGSGATSYPHMMCKADEYAAAAEALLELKSIPDFMEVINIDRQIATAIADEAKLKSSTNADEAAKIIKAKKDNQSYLATLYKQKSEAAERFRKQCLHSGMITPDEIWATI